MTTKIIPPGTQRHEPHPFLSRSYLEAQLIAVSVLRQDVAMCASRRALGRQLSPDAFALLSAIARDPVAAWIGLTTLAESAGQFDLANAALDLTLDALRFHSVDTLVSLALGPLQPLGLLPEKSSTREVAA